MEQVIIRNLLCKHVQLISALHSKMASSVLDTSALRPCSLLSLISSHLGLLALNVNKQALAGVFEIESGLVQPWMRADLVYRRPACRIVAEKRLNEVFKLRA
jgi:hypothetical protein